MKFKEFRKKMVKNIFLTAEAHLVAFRDDPKHINVELHNWKKSGDIIQLKRGLSMFADQKYDIVEISKALCSPCYFSLEYVLNLHSIIPEAVFSYTLVTRKKTREFNTPVGNFMYHTIKKEAFTGFDATTLLAEPEKALVDYFYLKGWTMHDDEVFWEESRLDGSALNFKKVFRYAHLFKSKKLVSLLASFHHYAKSHKNYR